MFDDNNIQKVEITRFKTRSINTLHIGDIIDKTTDLKNYCYKEGFVVILAILKFAV